MIFNLLIILNHDRISSTTRVPHTTTWDYFASHLPKLFHRSPEVVKEAIMTDINDLVQDFWKTSSDGAIEVSFFEMRRFLEILQECIGLLEVCFDIVSVFATATDKDVQSDNRLNRDLSDLQDDDQVGAKFKRLLDGYRNMIDHSSSKSTC